MTDLLFRYRYSLMWAAYIAYLITVFQVVGTYR